LNNESKSLRRGKRMIKKEKERIIKHYHLVKGAPESSTRAATNLPGLV
jgi:hypothetical protein